MFDRTCIFFRKKNSLPSVVATIFLPLIVMGTIGWTVDEMRDSSKNIFLLIGVLIAFLITNVGIFFHFRSLSRQMEEHLPKEDDEKEKS